MPIYEYQCKKCDHIFEVNHKMCEKPRVYCPKCIKPAKKIISTGGFILKGEGFYNRSRENES